MTRRSIITMVAMFIAMAAIAQDNAIEKILHDIESNNRALAALRAGNEAMRLDNLTGLNLEDPEVSVSYMRGFPHKGHDIDKNKINIEVTQGFDFATLSGAKKRVAKSQNNILELQYRQQALEVELQARQCIVNLTYYNALNELLEHRLHEYTVMMDKAQTALDSGGITIMDMNSIRLHRYSIENDLRMARIERESVQNELDLLNGGNHVEYTASKYCPDELPPNFESWYAQASAANPALNILSAQIDANRDALTLAKREGLPGFSVGYTNEIVPTDGSLHGVVVGFSLPLWNNAGKVNAAKAMQAATQAEYEETALRFMAEMKSGYERTASLGQLADQCDEMVTLSDNKEYLDKSLTAGKITMIDYVTETDAFTDMKIKALDAWKEYHLSLAVLLSYAR